MGEMEESAGEVLIASLRTPRRCKGRNCGDAQFTRAMVNPSYPLLPTV
jgi:hypothetical protein